LTVGLVYEYPWGDFRIAFSPFNSKAAYEWTYNWNKSSETDGLVDPSEGPQPGLYQKLEIVDRRLDHRFFMGALQELYWRVSLQKDESRFPVREVRKAVRLRLIKWKELEKKPKVVAYLQEAPYEELVQTMHQIISGERTEFFTAKEYAAFPYRLTGELDKDFKGQCIITGFHGCRVATINEKTEAAQELFHRLKIKLPIEKNSGPGIRISPVPGPLLDRIAEEQTNNQ